MSDHGVNSWFSAYVQRSWIFRENVGQKNNSIVSKNNETKK